jgi:hypothetical protein
MMRESIAFSIIIAMIIMISVLGPIFVTKRVDEMTQEKPKVTGHATNVQVAFTLLKRMDLSQLNLSADLSWDDNSTIVLSWSNLSADNYSVWISDNVSDLLNDSALGVPNVSGITDLNWSDPTSGSVSERYYRLGITLNNLQNLSLETVGKLDYFIYDANLSTSHIEFNIISFPLEPTNKSLSNIFRWSRQGESIMTYNTSRRGMDGAIYMAGNWFSPQNMLEIDVGKSYYIEPFKYNYTMTFTGRVPTENQTKFINISDQNPLFVEINNVGWHSAFRKCGMNDLLSNDSSNGDTVMWYNPVTRGMDGTQNFGGTWFSFGLNCMEPGKGYIFGIVNNPYNWTYDPDLDPTN